jgi:plasmid stability protein
MANLQVMGLDDDLYEALRARANMDHRSISQEVVTIINEFLSQTHPETGEAGGRLLNLAGSWEDERRAEEIVADLRSARRTGRRFGEDEYVSD